MNNVTAETRSLSVADVPEGAAQTVRWRASESSHERLVWLREQATAGYWDHLWANAGSLALAVRAAKRHPVLLELFLRHTAPGSTVLEGGCGRGQWVNVLRAHGRSAVGVDFAPETLVRSRREPEGAALPLLTSDVLGLPFPDATFDSYLSLGVAEHFIAGPEALLEEAHRVLRRGGVLLSSVPYYSPLRRLRATLGGFEQLKGPEPPPKHFYQFAFSPVEFRQCLERAGFRVLEQVPFAPIVGLLEDVPYLSRLDRLVMTWRHNARVARQGAGSNNGSGHGGGQSSGSLNPGGGSSRIAARVRALARAAIHSGATRTLAGHMVMYVARRD